MFKLLVCGGRDFDDYPFLCKTLDRIRAKHPDLFIIEGDAPGADEMAGVYADERGVPCAKVPANWGYYKKAAGPIRNTWMLRLSPDACCAFKGGNGTADMVRQCEAMGVPVYKAVDKAV